VRKLSRRTTIFMVATGVLLTASVAFAFINVVGISDAFSASVAGDDPKGKLKVTVETDGDVQLGPESEPEKLVINVENLSTFAVTLDENPVTLEVETGPASPDCDENDLVLDGLDDLPNEELAPAGEDESSEDDVVFLSLNDAEGSTSAEDCAGADLQIKVKVTGTSTEDIGGDDEEPVEPVTGSSDLS
jgi:hypothetical protein